MRYLNIYRGHKDLIQVETEVAQMEAEVRAEWNKPHRAFRWRIERPVRRA